MDLRHCFIFAIPIPADFGTLFPCVYEIFGLLVPAERAGVISL